MFELYADKNNLLARQIEQVTSGSVNVYTAQFQFSADWEELERTAVFQAGSVTVSVRLDETGQCVIPWEVLKTPGFQLKAGVYGLQGSDVILPTVWAHLGVIRKGVTAGDSARPPTPDLWEQALARKADGLSYDGRNLSLLSGDTTLSAVQLSGGSGDTDERVSDHRLLTGRDAEDQHPIQAIAGLREELNSIPAPVEPITNLELEEFLQ